MQTKYKVVSAVRQTHKWSKESILLVLMAMDLRLQTALIRILTVLN